MSERFLPVPVIPNASLATGQIEGIILPHDRSQDAIISLRVERAESIAGMPDFLASEVGHTIDVIVKQGRQISLRAGDTVRLKVSYEGDERGGGFYARASDFELIA